MYTISEVCRLTGMSDHTLRYYEREGLLTGVRRSKGGFRQYSDENLEELGLISCLKNTGMSLQEIARFMRLTHEGDETLKERVALLQAHREEMLGRLSVMQRYLEKINCKLDFFSGKLRAYEEHTREERAAQPFPSQSHSCGA